MNRQEFLDSCSREWIMDNILKNYNNRPDDYECYEINNVRYTVGEFRRQIEKIDKDIYNSKKAAIDSLYNEEELQRTIDTYTRQGNSDNHVVQAAYAGRPDITFGDLKMRMEDIKKEKYESKKAAIDSLYNNEEALQRDIDTYTRQGNSDDHVVQVAYAGRPDITFGDLKMRMEEIKEEKYQAKVGELGRFPTDIIESTLATHIKQGDPDENVVLYNNSNTGFTLGDLKKYYKTINNGNDFNIDSYDDGKHVDPQQPAQTPVQPQSTVSEPTPEPDEQVQEETVDEEQTEEEVKENPYEHMSEEEINARLNQLWNGGIASGEFEPDDKEVIEYHDLLAELNRRKTEQEKEFNPFENMSEEDINRRLGELWRESISSGELEDDDPAVKEYHDLLDELNRRREAEKAKAAEEAQSQAKDEEEKLEWDPRLTQEQIDDAKSRDIYEPKGDEYEQFLNEVGLDNNKEETPKEEAPVEETTEEEIEETEEPEKDEPFVEVPDEKKKFDKEKAKALLKKGLYFAGGFAAGLGMSCVPGVGVIRTGLAAVKTVQFTSKLVNKGINAWTNKHPDGKVATVVNKINNSKAGQWVERTSTNIGNAWNNSAIGRGVNNIKAKLKSTPIKYAVNGVALGYLTGNMVELFTGKTVLQNIADKVHHEPQIIQDNTQGLINNSAQEPVNTTPQSTQAYSDYGLSSTHIPTQPTAPEIPTASMVEQTIKSGQTVDISSLHYGGVSSVSDPIALNTAAGQHVLFDKAVVLDNGQEMWHMAQADTAGNLIGKGYAWFPKEQVIEAVQGLSQTGITR